MRLDDDRLDQLLRDDASAWQAGKASSRRVDRSLFREDRRAARPWRPILIAVAVIALATTASLLLVAGLAPNDPGIGVARPSATSPAPATVMPMPDPTDVPSAPPTAPTTRPTVRPTRTPDYDALAREQAQIALDRWAQIVSGNGADAIVFTTEMTRGGGWHGRDANEKKSAFLSGDIEATIGLPTEPPPAADVRWPDGTTSSVALLSAAEAFDLMVSGFEDVCDDCRALEVIGARLTTASRETTRGLATVPAWQFEFADADEPLTPVTQPAVRDHVYIATAPWPYTEALGPPTLFAVGKPEDTEITVAFVGSPRTGDNPCGADYTGEAVESDLGIVVIVHSHNRASPRPTGPVICTAEGAMRTATATLSSPLGSRSVLSLENGSPVTLYREPPD